MRSRVRLLFTRRSAAHSKLGAAPAWRVRAAMSMALGAGVLAAGCQTSDAPLDVSEPVTSVAVPAATAVPRTMLVAYPHGTSVAVYGSPGASQAMIILPNPWLLNGVSADPIPQAFLVLQSRRDGWVRVLLPLRPNGSAGWIAPGAAQLLVDPYRIEVSLHEHRVVVARYGSPVYSGPAATGAPATPTPTGLFYIRVLLHTTDSRSPYGPYAYGLSAHSEALNTFDGGDAEIGVHGNNNPAVLGSSVTHGCVRMDNTEVSRLASVLPLGTPVEISA